MYMYADKERRDSTEQLHDLVILRFVIKYEQQSKHTRSLARSLTLFLARLASLLLRLLTVFFFFFFIRSLARPVALSARSLVFAVNGVSN